MKTNISMSFKGNCEEALQFYAKILGSEVTKMEKFKDMPSNENFKTPDEHLEKVMHAELKVSDNVYIFANDDIMNMSTVGTSIGISLNFDNTEELSKAENIFNGLSNEGTVIMPFGKTFWGAYYGLTIDKFGVRWEVNYQI